MSEQGERKTAGLEWSREPPTQDGGYWFCWAVYPRIVLWEVRNGKVVDGTRVEGYNGLWFGPIEPPPPSPYLLLSAEEARNE
jgi:hypothetical protein